jgi:hypothetical protein
VVSRGRKLTRRCLIVRFSCEEFGREERFRMMVFDFLRLIVSRSQVLIILVEGVLHTLL